MNELTSGLAISTAFYVLFPIPFFKYLLIGWLLVVGFTRLVSFFINLATLVLAFTD